MSSPSLQRRKAAPKEPPPTTSPSPEPVPPPPQGDDEESRREEALQSDWEDNNPANTATIINPSDIPRTVPVSLLMTEDQTPQPPKSSRIPWDPHTSSLPASPEVSRRQKKSAKKPEQPKASTPVITVNTQGHQPTSESPIVDLNEDKVNALSVLLSKPPRSDNLIYNYVRKETKNLLLQSKKVTPSCLHSPVSQDKDSEAKVWMAALFGNTIKRIDAIMPIPKEIKDMLPNVEVPEVSLIDFIKYALEQDTQKGSSDFKAYITEDNSELVSYFKEPKPVQSWSDAFNNYTNASNQEKREWKETCTFYPFPLSEFNKTTSLEAKQDFKRKVMEATRKWRTPDTPIAHVYSSTSKWKEGLMMSKIYKTDIMEDTMQIHATNKVQGKD